ncbi:MAG: cysteine--tRNA ligase [Candidatus Eremiobacteraeota bacterium]|nr:cysteine--tRNA ligase [Candidatus Eremiobacteraeota bacterium]
MSLRLFNTRTRSLENFRSRNEPDVDIYVCGLTPSAEAHLGHARTYLFFDVLRRYLEHQGWRVRYVQNVTDIDDRSIARARETGEQWYDIVRGYYATFKDAMKKLSVREPDREPYATMHIPSIQAMIRELIERTYAYPTVDGIYYDVSQFKRYGQFSGRNLDELMAGARIEVDEHKADPLDFALWKFAKPGEPSWEFPGYGAGRPGWHIECSAMSREILGERFDIHGGGADLIFPHHENEIAQSEPLMREPPMADFWIHAGMLLFDKKKMSKSLGNFEPLSALLTRHDPQAIRLLFLQTGYSKVMNFTEESITAASMSLEKLKSGWRTLRQAEPNGAPTTPAQGLLQKIEAALDNDMNTAGALGELHSYLTAAEKSIGRGAGAGFFAPYDRALNLLGLIPDASWSAQLPESRTLPPDVLQQLAQALDGELVLDGISPEEAVGLVVELRAQARRERDFRKSDRLRDVLANCGVTLKDSSQSTTWSIGD